MTKELEVVTGEVSIPDPKVQMKGPYPVEILDEDEDNGTMPGNVEALEENIVGSKIVNAGWRTSTIRGRYNSYEDKVFVILLETGVEVQLVDDGDCCAYTSLENFFLNPQLVDHVITGIGTTDGYQTWHIFCDYGDILKLDVGWSCGNPFYYGYGFDIRVIINGSVVENELEGPKQEIATKGPIRMIES